MTLLKLSRLLDYSFEAEAAKGSAPQETQEPQAAPEPQPQAAPKPKTRRWMIACAALAVALCVAVGLWLHSRHSATVFRDSEGKTYTMEEFKQQTPREEGKGWLTTEKVVKVQQGDGYDLWMYDFKFHEMNGVAMTIDRLEVYTFVGELVYPPIIEGSALPDLEIETTIPAGGEWNFTGGMPVQEKVGGVGVRLTTVDDNGTKQVFTDFLRLNAVE